MPERPSGVVTFLFTDIEGSTPMLRDLGPERYRSLLEEHRRILRPCFTRYGGHEEGTEGDSFLVAFASPRDAVDAAAAGQAALDAHPWSPGARVHVRMGIHSGEATVSQDGYVGIAVHRAARITAAGHGDQILISETTVDLLREHALPYQFVDLGAHRLKDLTEPQHIFQLESGQPASIRRFPPLRTLALRATNLPTQPTALVRREREVRAVMDLVRRPEVRLVTLTGPGGTGKTRLAMQAGAELLDEFDDGVWFVPLGAVADPQLVIPAVAASLSLNEAAGQSLAAFLSGKRLLLLMDNFEQVVESASAVAELLANAPDIKVLITSREALRVTSERVFVVPALALPDMTRLPPAATLTQVDSVALFVERARSALPTFRVTNENARAVAEICVRLDGLPLALELAAARIALLAPDQMLQRLGDRLKLLTGGARDMPARHQTLRAALEWSHDLLAKDEQTLFARVAVFGGGFTLDAAEAVCGADLDVLGSLVDKSLVRADSDRFAMLETVREYAHGRLETSVDAEAIRDRHAAYYESLVERAYPERITAESERSAELERDTGNLRAALDRLESTDPVRALAMAANLGWFWHVHSHLGEGRARLERAVKTSSAPIELRARALAALGEITARQGDEARTRAALDEAGAIFEKLGLRQERALALHELGWGLFFAGDDHAAREAMDESLRIQRSIGDELLINRAQLGLLQVLVALGDVDTVEPLALESLDAARRLGDLRGEQLAYHFLADSALIRGDAATSESRYRDALRAAIPLGDRIEIAFEIQGVAMSLAGLGHHEQGVRLASAAAATLDALGLNWTGVPFWSALEKRYIGSAREALRQETAGRASDAGREMGIAAAIDEALDSAA